MFFDVFRLNFDVFSVRIDHWRIRVGLSSLLVFGAYQPNHILSLQRVAIFQEVNPHFRDGVSIRSLTVLGAERDRLLGR